MLLALKMATYTDTANQKYLLENTLQILKLGTDVMLDTPDLKKVYIIILFAKRTLRLGIGQCQHVYQVMQQIILWIIFCVEKFFYIDFLPKAHSKLC